MRRAVRTALACSLVSLGATATAWALLSFAAAFDMIKPVSVLGSIVQIRLEKRLSWFFLVVKEATCG